MIVRKKEQSNDCRQKEPWKIPRPSIRAQLDYGAAQKTREKRLGENAWVVADA
jgi:hypothetical protein